jgi:hypothetical protein
MSDNDSEIELKRLLEKLRASAPRLSSDIIEERLRQACRERRKQRHQRLLRFAGLGLAACLLFALGLDYYRSKSRVAPKDSDYAGFLALPYAQSDIPLERAIVVRVDLQPGDLAGLGLPPALVTGKGQRRADLLIGQDGVARAVRFAP